jgi:hypothetical protein
MPLVRLPGLEVIARRNEVEAGARCRFTDRHDLGHGKLFMRDHIPKDTPTMQTRRAARVHYRCSNGTARGLKDGFPRHHST